MTTTDTSGEILPAGSAAQKQQAASNDDDDNEEIEQLEFENMDLREEIADLRKDALFIDPYALPPQVAEALISQLAGWPARRWRELAALIEAHVVRSMPMPPTSSTAERRAAP